MPRLRQKWREPRRLAWWHSAVHPAGATTNSDAGVTDLRATTRCWKPCKGGLVFCVHGEVTDSDVDVFDREKAFIDDKLIPAASRFP